MSAYMPDTYRVVFLDNQQRSKGSRTADSFTDAMEQGQRRCDGQECADFAVYRVLYNSAVPHFERWDIRPK